MGRSSKVFLSLLFFALFSTLAAQEVTEEMTVRWWVVPFYAVDGEGQAVTDVSAEDLRLTVNGKAVENFVIYRRPVTEEATVEESVTPPASQKDRSKRKLVFLIFDDMATQSWHVKKCKKLAREIIIRSPEGLDFIVMILDPFRGLEHVCGPTTDKIEVRKAVAKHVKGWQKDLNNREFGMRDIAWHKNSLFYKGSRYKVEGGFDVPYYKNRYISSLQNLDAVLKIFMAEGKVVYLFTTGIRKDIFIMDTDSKQYLDMKRIAERYNQNGSLLFVINPAGTRDIEGREKMRFLAKESGGEYLEGTEESITRRVVQLNRGYYEVGFADPGEGVREFDVQLSSVKEDLKIHSIRRLSKGKTYLELNDVERSLLPLNMIEDGFWAKSIYDLTYRELIPETTENQHLCTITLPDSYLNHEVDLFTLLIHPVTEDVQLKRERVIYRGSKQEIEIKAREGYRPNIVVINWEGKEAVVYRSQ